MNKVNQEETEQSQKAIYLFYDKYWKLDAGDRAQLRRADSPDLVKAFWFCFNPAKKIYSYLSIKRCGHLLRFFPMLAQQAETGEQKIGIGKWLRKNKQNVSLRRVETLFTLNDLEELLDELLAIAAIVTSGDKKNRKIDYHGLYWELWRFEQCEEKRLQLQRSWARDYFQDIEQH